MQRSLDRAVPNSSIQRWAGFSNLLQDIQFGAFPLIWGSCSHLPTPWHFQEE